MTHDRLATGAAGERATLAAYRRRGYRLLAANWRCPLGELDLVLARGDTLVICEVKSRRGGIFGDGWEAVDHRKRRKLRAVATVFLRSTHARHDAIRFDAVATVFLRSTHARHDAIRFDVASVRLARDGSAQVEVFEDAF